jgi:hypothetical protein
VRFTVMKEEGPYRLLGIEGEGLSRPSLRLVLIGPAGQPEEARLLVLGEEDKITALIPLRIVKDPTPAA